MKNLYADVLSTPDTTNRPRVFPTRMVSCPRCSLSQQSNLMGEELDRQTKALESLDTKVERDQAMLKDVNKKVGKMLGKKG